MPVRGIILSAAIVFLTLIGSAFAQTSPQLGANASGVGFYIVSPSCSSQPQVSGANLCFDTTVGQLFSFGGATYSNPTTGSAAAGGTTGCGQYNNSGVLGGLCGTGLYKLNGAGAPTIAVANTDYQAALSSGSPASTTIGGSGLSAPAANGFLYSNGSSPFGLLNLGVNQIPVGTAGAPTSLSLIDCPRDGQHAYTYDAVTAHAFVCVTVTASVTAPGTTGSTVWTSGTVLAAFSGTGLLKLNGSSSPSIGVSGTDYAPATSGSAIQKANGSGGFSAAVAGTDYVPPISTNNITVLQANDVANDGNFLNLIGSSGNMVQIGGGSIVTGIALANSTTQNQGTFSSGAYVDTMPVNSPSFMGGVENCAQNQHDYTLASNPAVITLSACPGGASIHQKITYLFSQPTSGALGSYTFQATNGVTILGATITASTACQSPGCQDVVEAEYYGTRNEWILNLKYQNLNGVATCPAGQTCYYFDSVAGSDSNVCSQASPCASISKAMTFLSSLQPGDEELFKTGDIWTASVSNPSFVFGDTAQHAILGSASKPVKITTYGTAAQPIIEANNVNAYCFGAYNPTFAVQYLTVSGFECRHAFATGIYFVGNSGSTPIMPGITISNNFVHNTGPGCANTGSSPCNNEYPEWTGLSHAYAATTLLHPVTNNAGGYRFINRAACTGGSGANPTWPQTISNTVADSGCTWTNVGISDGWFDWAQQTVYPATYYVEPQSNNAGQYVYVTSGSCTSGNSRPSFSQVVGAVTSDSAGGGNCSWTNTGVVGEYKNQVGFEDDGIAGGHATDGTQVLNNIVKYSGGHDAIETHGDQGGPLVQGNVVGPGANHGYIDSHMAGSATGPYQVIGNVVYGGYVENLNSCQTNGSCGTVVLPDYYYDNEIAGRTTYAIFQGNVATDGFLGFQVCPSAGSGTNPLSFKAYNNTIYIPAGATPSWGIYAGLCPAGSNAGSSIDLRNNIFDGGAFFSIATGTGWTTAIEDYNDIGGAQGSPGFSFNGSTTPGTHDFSNVNPNYTNAALNNFTLAMPSTSPVGCPTVGTPNGACAGLAGLTQGNNHMGAY